MPAACGVSSLQLSISAETVHTASHFKLLLEYKTRIPRPSPSPKHGKMLMGVTALAFDLCVLYYPSPLKNQEKRATASLIV
jgi:hypothetical protein